MARVLDRGGKIIDTAPSGSFLLQCTFTKIGGKLILPCCTPQQQTTHPHKENTAIHACSRTWSCWYTRERTLRWCDDNLTGVEKVSTGQQQRQCVISQYNWAVVGYFLQTRASKNGKISLLPVSQMWWFAVNDHRLNLNFSLFSDILKTVKRLIVSCSCNFFSKVDCRIELKHTWTITVSCCLNPGMNTS